MSKELLQLALDALEYHTAQTRPIERTSVAIDAIRVTLAQPSKPEPKHCIMCLGKGWHYMANAYPPGVNSPEIKINCNQCVAQTVQPKALSPERLLQDDSRGLSKALSNTLNARATVLSLSIDPVPKHVENFAKFGALRRVKHDPIAQYSDIVSDGRFDPRNTVDVRSASLVQAVIKAAKAVSALHHGDLLPPAVALREALKALDALP